MDGAPWCAAALDDNQRLAVIVGIVQRVDEIAPVGFEKLAGVVHRRSYP